MADAIVFLVSLLTRANEPEPLAKPYPAHCEEEMPGQRKAAMKRRAQLAAEVLGRLPVSDAGAIEVLKVRLDNPNPKTKRHRANLVDQAAAAGFENLLDLAEATGLCYQSLIAIRNGRRTGGQATKMLLAILATSQRAPQLCRIAKPRSGSSRTTLP